MRVDSTRGRALSKPWTKYAAAALAIAVAVVTLWFASGADPVVIAVMLTASDNGPEVKRELVAHFRDVNAAGGVDGTPVELEFYEPIEDADQAMAAAASVRDSGAWLLIGPNISSTAVVAAGVLDGEIVAVTPTATAIDVTLEHDWFFRTAPSTRRQGNVLANYLLHVVGARRVAIIQHENDAYSASFTEEFSRPFEALGGTASVKELARIEEAGAEQVREARDTVISELIEDTSEPLDAIVLAIFQSDAVEFIVDLRRRGVTTPIVGGDALVQSNFVARLRSKPEERSNPGIFSDGILATAPFLFDTADEDGRLYRQWFKDTYPESEPGWDEAATHDAALVAEAAIRSAQHCGRPETTRAARDRVFEYFSRQGEPRRPCDGDQPGTAETYPIPRGLLGRLEFDDNGEPHGRVWISRLHRHRQLSAPIQLAPEGRIADPEDLVAAFEAGELLAIGGEYMRKAAVVYAGMDFNQISNFDGLGGFTADFFLWLRYPEFEGLDPVQVRQVELVEISTGQQWSLAEDAVLVHSMFDDGLQYELYRVKADFTNTFDFHDYPFDTQQIQISLRNRSLTRDRLIYVVDEEGIGDTTTALRPTNAGQAFSPGGTWSIGTVSLYESGIRNLSSFGDPHATASSGVEYSQLQATIEIKRNVPGFLTKKFLPVLILMALAYLVFYMPSDSFGTINGTLSGTLVAVALFHFGLTTDLPGVGYAVALDFAFYGMYMILVATLLVTLIAWQKEANKRLVHGLLLTARIGYPSLFAVGALAFMFTYDLGPRPLTAALARAAETTRNRVFNNLEPVEDANTDKISLTLASWRTDDHQGVQNVLAGFNASHDDIEVTFVPSVTENFDDRLRGELERGQAADLLYARGNYRSLFNDGHLVDVTDLVDSLAPNDDQWIPGARQHWSTRENEPRMYALPMMAISQGIYYNERIFADVDVDIEPPLTWEELLAAAQTLQSEGYTPFGNFTGDFYGEVVIFQSLAPNFVGSYGTSNEGRCFNDRGMVDSLAAFTQLAPFFAADHDTISPSEAEQRFFDGESAMFWGGSWDFGRFSRHNDEDFTLGMFLPPPPDGTDRTVIYQPDFGIAINSATTGRRLDAARQFLTWIGAPENMEELAMQVAGFDPLRRDVDRRKIAGGLAGPDAFLQLAENPAKVRRWDLPGNGVPSGRLLLRRALRRLIAPAVAGEQSTNPEREADTIQQGLATWYRPVQDAELGCRVPQAR